MNAQIKDASTYAHAAADRSADVVDYNKSDSPAPGGVT